MAPSRASAQSRSHPPSPDSGLIGRVGALGIDWPRSAGYFGGIGLALGFGMVDPPLAVFIAAVPFIKMLNRRGAPAALRTTGQFFEGMSKPVGGDSEGTLWLNGPAPREVTDPLRDHLPTARTSAGGRRRRPSTTTARRT